jgi:hypothetical protein
MKLLDNLLDLIINFNALKPTNGESLNHTWCKSRMSERRRQSKQRSGAPGFSVSSVPFC